MTKKIRRRRSAPTSKKSQKLEVKTSKQEQELPSLEEQEATASQIKDVIPKIYQRSGWDRLNSIPDYTEKLNPNRLETIIANFYAMTPDQLTAAARDPYATILEKTLLQMFKSSMDVEDKEKNSITQYLHSRFAGLPKKIVEFNGNLDQQLHYESKKIPDISNMNKAQRQKFRELIKASENLPMKEIQVEIDGEE